MQSAVTQWLESNFISSGTSYIFIVTFIIALSCHIWRRRPPDAPPGSNGLPIIGMVASIRDKPERVMARWNKDYGPVCMMKMGFSDVVILGSLKAVQEAFVKSSSFSDRPATALEVFADGKGVILLNANSYHKVQRRFTLNGLREFGMGRRSLEPRLIEMSNRFCDKIEALCAGKSGRSSPFTIDPMIYESVASVISQIVFGFDLVEENEDFKKLLLKMIEPNKFNVLSGILIFAPALKYLPGFSRILVMAQTFRRNMNRFIQGEVEAHQQHFHPHHPRDFVDSFLNEMRKRRARSPARKIIFEHLIYLLKFKLRFKFGFRLYLAHQSTNKTQ